MSHQGSVLVNIAHQDLGLADTAAGQVNLPLYQPQIRPFPKPAPGLSREPYLRETRTPMSRPTPNATPMDS